MRLKLFLVCVILALIGAGWTWDGGKANGADLRTVYIVPQSKLVHRSDIENALPAFQAGISEDFAPIWGQDAELVVTDTPPAGATTISVEDYSDVSGALGYHGFENDHVYARVFASDSVQYDDSWQGVLDHELKEMLADPYIDRLTLGKRLWLVEVADPVEADNFNYARKAADGSLVPLSDFVTPAWYRKRGKGPYDFKRHVKHPGQILWGGYASYWQDDTWHELNNFKQGS